MRGGHHRRHSSGALRRIRRGAASLVSSESGQALVFGALTLFMLAAFVIFQVDMGRVSSTRIQVQNAADECAYGGALYEANVCSSVAYLNEAMAYLYYDALRYAVDTTVTGVLATLKQYGPPRYPAPPDRLVYDDEDQDAPRYSGNPIGHYNRAYDRAAEWVPQIERTLNLLARWEWGMALSCAELVKMEIHRTALKHGVEAVAVYPDVDFFPGNGVQFDLHILKLMSGGEHVGWRIWTEDPPFFIEARKLGPFHWLITRSDGTTYEIERISEDTYRVRTGDQDITVTRIDDDHVRLKLLRHERTGTTQTNIDARYLEGLGWAVAMSSDDYDVTYRPMAGNGYRISVQNHKTGRSGTAGVRRGPNGRIQQYVGGAWQDVPGQRDSVTVGGVDIPVQIDNRIHLGEDTWFRVPNELHLRNVTYLIPNIFRMPNIWVTVLEEAVRIDAFIDIPVPGGSRRLRFTIDESNFQELIIFGLLGRNYRVPGSATCKWFASRDGKERDRLCRDCQLIEGECTTPASRETKWTYQYRLGNPYFIKEDLRRFGHHAICDRDPYARSHGFEYPQWANRPGVDVGWYDIARGEPLGRDYFQTRPQWGAPPNYDSDGDGKNDSVRIYANDRWALNRTEERVFDPHFQKVKPWQLHELAGATTRFAPPLRLSEDFFFYGLTVGCWRSPRGTRDSPFSLFGDPRWGVVAAASARAGFLELQNDEPEADDGAGPHYRFTWPRMEQVEQFVNAGYENLYEPVWTAHLWPMTDAIRSEHLRAYVTNQTGLSYLLYGLMHTYWYEPLSPDQLGEEPRRRDDVPRALGHMHLNTDHPRIGEVIQH